MIQFCGLMRVKNEERWLEESLESLLRLCDKVYVLDDNSTDLTYEICTSYENVCAYRSPFDTTHEARDREWLLNKASLCDPEWFISVDGDEILEEAGPGKIRAAAKLEYDVMQLFVLYYWNGVHQIRCDGNFNEFFLQRAFRARRREMPFLPGEGSTGLHCYSVPKEFLACPSLVVSAALWHYGYVDESLRREKYERYREQDPVNAREDNYRHIIQGDEGGPSAQERLVHGGPLQLESVTKFLSGPGMVFSRRPRDLYVPAH